MSENPNPSAAIEVTAASYPAEVLDRSAERLVLLDFTAGWCPPCKMLAPRLEKLAAEHAQDVVLAKVDIDKEPGLAAHFRVQSVPQVFAIKDRAVVDHFSGALPEPALRSWLLRWLPTPAGRRASEAAALIASDPDAAARAYREAIALAPDDPAIAASAAGHLLTIDHDEEVRALIDRFAARGYLEPALEKVRASLQLREHAPPDRGLDDLEAAVAANPEDLPLKLRLAEALAVAERWEPALEACLELVERDRKGVGEQARQAMLNIFRVLPPDSPLATRSRRRLSALLY